MPRAILARFILLVFVLSASSIVPATAHIDAKLEIYKAITIPRIDGTYNMTSRQAQVGGKNLTVDEWSDATWIEVPKVRGDITAYSGYKHDDKFLYMAHAVLVTHLGSGPGNELSYAVTVFDPNHDGETKETKWDDFKIDLWHEKDGFHFYARFPYPQSWSCPNWVPDPPGCEYGCCDTCSPCKRPEGLIGSSSFGVTPFGSTSCLFYEARVPLTANQPYANWNLLKNPIFGIEQIVDNQNMSKNVYPCEPESCNVNAVSANNFTDATLGNTTNPNVTVPPTIVPEFPTGFAPLVAVAVLTACVMLARGCKFLSQEGDGSTRSA